MVQRQVQQGAWPERACSLGTSEVVIQNTKHLNSRAVIGLIERRGVQPSAVSGVR